MNVGIVTTWFERGAGVVSKQFADIIGQRHPVFVYARGGESFAKDDPRWNLPYVYWSRPYKEYRSYVAKKEFCTWLRRHAIDAVVFNEQTFFEPMLWCKEMGVRTIAYIDYYTEEMLPLFHVYDALICNTRRHCSAFEGFPTVQYIPWGTHTALYKPASDDGRLVEEGVVTFFNSAGVSPERKGTDTFIKALDRCADVANVKGIVHTQISLDKKMPTLGATIARLQREGRLEVVEKTVPAPGLYCRADVYVYPSVLDGIGLTVPEAISSGLACLASDNPPMNEFVQPDFGRLIAIDRLYARSDGYYWPQCRCVVDSLAQHIRDLAGDPALVVRMKRQARAYALRHLSFEDNAQRIFDVLEGLALRPADERLKAQIRAFDRKGMKKLWLAYNRSGLSPLLDRFA